MLAKLGLRLRSCCEGQILILEEEWKMRRLCIGNKTQIKQVFSTHIVLGTTYVMAAFHHSLKGDCK